MGLLDKLGLARKRARPVGQKLEKGRTSGRGSDRKRQIVKASILLALLALTLAAFPREEVHHYTVQVGDEWRGETLEAPFDFTIYKDPADLAAEEEQIRY